MQQTLNVYRMLARKFIEKYGIDTEKYDVIKGWRANASYFYIAKEFVRDNIDMDILEELLSLDGFGIQYCIKLELAYSHIDEAQAYVNTMEAQQLWEYFLSTEQYTLKAGKSLDGFMPDWIGEFYAYYQWYYNMPSAEVIKKVPIDFLKKAYYGLHDLELDLAVQKVGEA